MQQSASVETQKQHFKIIMKIDGNYAGIELLQIGVVI